MPNPRAQAPSPLDQAVQDIKNVSQSGGAAFGVFPQMTGRRSQQDPEAAKGMPVAAARGWVAGTLGLPADLINIGGVLYNMATGQQVGKVPYGTEYWDEKMPLRDDTPAGRAASGLGSLFGGVGVGKPAKALGREAGSMVNDAMVYGQGPLAAITPQPMRMFVGPKSQTYDMGRALKAEEMLKAGKSPEEVWKATGTMIGKDGIPRQEISDAGATFRTADDIRQLKENYKGMIEAGKEKLRPDRSGQKDLFPKQLTEAKKPFREQLAGLKQDFKEIDKNPRTQGVSARFTLEHPELYRAYPELADIRVYQKPTIGSEKGSLTTLGGVIQDLEVKDIKDPRSVALHEMQHAIQNIEGMGLGGNPTFAFQHPEAAQILNEKRNLVRKATPFEDYVRQGGYHTDDPQEMARAKKDYDEYVQDLPDIASKLDRELQRDAAMEWYKRQHGEAEARATQKRKDMGQTERQQTFPYESFDIKPEDLLVRKGPPHLGVSKSIEGESRMPEDLRRLQEEFRRKAAEDQALLDAYNRATRGVPLNERPSMEEFRATNVQPSQSELDQMRLELDDQQLAGGGEVRGYDNGGSIKATPRSEGWGTAADIAKAVEDLSKEQFGYKNPATEAIAEFLGIPAVARTLERKAYGEPVTNIGKANVPLLPDDTAEAAMTVAPFAGKAAKGAKALGKAGLSEVEKAMFGESSSKLLNAATPQVMGMVSPPADAIHAARVAREARESVVSPAAVKRVLAIKDHEERAEQAQKLIEKMYTQGQVYDKNEEALRQLHKAQTGARALPTVIPRARPKTKEEIREYAQRTADQLNAQREGKFFRASPEKSENPAGKSYAQWKMEQELNHDVRPLGTELDKPQVANIEDQLGSLKMGISGDTTIADSVLHRAGPYELSTPVEQQGGPLYGLRVRPKPVGWASNEGVLSGVQGDINLFSEAYGGVPVIGQYNAMGPSGSNFAQHLARSNLNATNISGMNPDKLEKFNDIIKKGNAASGPHPDFPGIQDPSASTYLGFFPELRKYYNALMMKPEITKQFGLPDGRVIQHAITVSDLRDMPVLTSGHSQFELVPGHDPKRLPLSEHSTYSHDLPRKEGSPVKQTPFPIPAEFEFSDVKEYAEPMYKPEHMTRVYQTASPRQIIDQQHIDEIKAYEDFMRQYAPESERKKRGGAIHVKPKKMATGGEITAEDLEIEERPL